MPINSLGVMADRARLESNFRGVNSSAPASSPAGGGGGVYHVRSNPGPAPVNRGRPLPSGGLQPRYVSSPSNPVNPDYVGSPSLSSGRPVASSAPASLPSNGPRPVNRALEPGFNARPNPIRNSGPNWYSGAPAARGTYTGSIQSTVAPYHNGSGSVVNRAMEPGFNGRVIEPGRAVNPRIPAGGGAGMLARGANSPWVGLGMMAIQAEMERRDWPTYSDYVAERWQSGDLGNVPGWLGYPNQTDPDSLGQGPQISPLILQSGGPGSSPVNYSVTVFYSDEFRPNTSNPWSPRYFVDTVTVRGPLQGIGEGLLSGSNRMIVFGTTPEGGAQTVFTSLSGASTSGCVTSPNYFRNCNQGIQSITRLDGQTDPPFQPEQPPVYAANPARNSRPTTPGLTPNLLPAPPTPDHPNWQPDTGDRWPETQPTQPPDTQPIAPAPATPPNFQPTAPQGEPNTPTNPNAPPGAPDLDPNAPPRETPPDLATDPDTPTRPAGSPFREDPERANRTRVFTPTIVPVPIPVGQRPPANTPSAPRLTGNPADNPNVRYVQQPVRQTPTEAPKGTCFYEFQRVADIQRKATDTQQRASNAVSGFPGLYGIGIESRVKLGETFTLVQTVNEFMRKAWKATRMDKALNLLTFIGVMHNVSMLSRDVGETFFQLISQALQAVGIRDEEDNVIDVGEVVGNTVENFLKTILGESTYNGINEAWNKANRIISSASAIIWTVRSIADSSLDLMEWIGENTGRIGNALKRWGVVGERSYPWMSESARAQGRWRSRFSKITNTLENAEDRLSVYTQATSTVIEIQDEVQEGQENWQRLQESVIDGIPDPWLDNNPIKDGYDASKAISDGPDVPPSEAQKG